MILKKKILFTIILLLMVFLTACAKKEVYNMDQLAPDGNYHYTNKDLGLSVDFGEEFKYYQTQRNDNKAYSEIEYFVPTSDREYPQQIQSYGKFLVVRIYNKNEYDENDNHEYFGEKNKKIFVGIFWEEIPSDWTNKWSDEIKQKIIASFKIN